MEGTRHERAAIVIASYIIGFITAFLFSANTGDITADPFISVPNTNPAAVVQAESVAPEVVKEEEVKVEVGTVTYKAGQLVYNGADGEHLLSFNPEDSELKADIETLTQGYHYGELNYKVSADGNFVFFCEVTSESDDTCTAYVYDANADRIYPVTMEGEAMTFAENLASKAIWTAVGLKVGSSYSVNASAPWAMMTTEGTLDLQ